ncbi:uncharacterized protein LOC115726702 isoform X2 [Rhodamnia argentea]|uniref:Uncharacterized protein LOC115726702 isoform X2 n=1 Tax=Rhodamnia argentea TaxID=178133 RepID=A0A8B8MNU2_9MYRT|nr:uncharacterized protein LOC115726702 isoform X2 [Rhodamnia argentea]
MEEPSSKAPVPAPTRTRTTQSAPPIAPSSQFNPKPPKAKEEGELSSSDDDDEPADYTAAQLDTGAVLSGRSHQALSASEISQGNHVKVDAGGPTAISIEYPTRPSIQTKHEKSLGMNQVGHKPGRSGTGGSSGPNSNLVISFSDDESSSDSDEGRQDKSSEDIAKTVRMNGNQKPPTLARKTSKKLGYPTRDSKQMMSKKNPSSRTFIHPKTKNQGANNGIGSAPSIGQGSTSRSLSMLNQKLECQEHGSDHVVGSRNLELQDLRQQIALRETELKLKLAHQNKQSVFGSLRNSYSLNLNRNPGGISVTASPHLPRSLDFPQLDAKEPPRKRLKVGVSSYAQRCVEQSTTAAKLCPPPKDLLLETGKMDKADHGPKPNSMNMTELSVTRCEMRDSERVVMASANLHGIADADHPERTSRMVNACSLSKQDPPLIRMIQNTSTKNTGTGMETNQLMISDGRNVLGSDPNQIRREHELMRSSKDDEVLTLDHAAEVSEKNSVEGSLKNMTVLSDLDNASGAEHGTKEMQSLIEIEESLDKKLDEAQEQRRRCEIEERNALKAYRKAQRALIEANAKCSQLYHQRELYSSRLRSFIMHDTSLFWSSLHNKHLGVQVKSSDNLNQNVDSLPSSSHNMQNEYDQSNQPGYASNIRCLDGVPGDSSHLPVNSSEQCSEPDASTSEPLSHKGPRVANEEFSPLIGPNRSVDEDVDIPPDHNFAQSKQGSQREAQKDGERHESMTSEVSTKISDENSHDFLLREATLRSELVARLGTKSSQYPKGSCSMEAVIEQRSQSDPGSEKTHMSNWSAPNSDAERVRHADFEGTNKLEGHPHDVVEEGESRMSLDNSASIIRSAFCHVKDVSSFKLSRPQQKRLMYDARNDEGVSIYSSTSSSKETDGGLLSEDTASYSCNVAVDPLWPLCMYELRGKCNNDECPWQHIKKCSDGKMRQNLYSDANDCHIESTSSAKRWAVLPSFSKCSPTYVVGLDILKADSRSYEAVVTQNIGQCWQKCFSISLVISSVPKQVRPMDDSVLQNSDGRIEISGCQSRQSSFFRNRNGSLNQINQGSIDGQALEMALLILNQDGNKLERKKKVGISQALAVLSRALEADPASVVLWSVYLVIYYSEMKTAGKDDMYYIAVKHNQGSYELWLMYINSRSKLEDRLHAYEDALLALCHHSSASNGHASTRILDLFLQMVNCFCLCGRVDKAIEMICETLPSAENSDERLTLLLSNILSRLTIADKCIFWICCVYLVIYRKLPDAIVQQFECEKELHLIDWPSAHLGEDDRQRAFDLVDFAIRCDITEASLADDANIRLAQHFAVNHFRCAVVLNGLNCDRYLLQRFETMYPTSLELLLLSARAGECDFEDFSSGFENALNKWPREAPGFHCIWNQFAEYALQNGRHDLAKDIMDRWFLSAWQVRYPHDEGVAEMDQDNSCSSPIVASQADSHAAASSYSRMDEIFGFLNLSLLKLLQNQLAEARVAIDKALHVATSENYKLCVREHAKFLLMDGTVAKEGAQISGILDYMSVYINDPRAFPITETLPRKFIGDIKRIRVQQLIKNILCPVSSNFSLVNLVLEAWCGPSLLPQEFDKPDHLVDFVEAMLEISPSNYPLAVSVCKLIKRDLKSSAVTSASLLFWASSVLLSTISHAVPVAPEYAWVEAAAVLVNISGIDAILDGFYKRALSVYPFSVKLWNSFLISMKSEKDASSVLRAAEEKGIEADPEFLLTIMRLQVDEM